MRVSKQLVYYHDDSNAYLFQKPGACLECKKGPTVENGYLYVDDSHGNTRVLKYAGPEMSAEIKRLYLKENIECETPDYSNVLEFTLNEGDLVKPIL